MRWLFLVGKQSHLEEAVVVPGKYKLSTWLSEPASKELACSKRMKKKV